MPGSSPSRRRFLKTTGAGAVTVTLAGCLKTLTNEPGTSDDDVDDGFDDRNGIDDENGVDDESPGNPNGTPVGGTFTIGYPRGFESLNVLTASSTYTWGLLDQIYQAGVFIEPAGYEAMPWVYTDWESEGGEGADDPMDVYFDVRDDLTWNDGEALTIEDVVFTYEYYVEQEPDRYLAAVGPIEAVSRGTDWDVHLELARPIGTWEVDQLGLPILAEHEWGDVTDHTTFETDDPIGLGPGRVRNFEPGSRAEIEFRDSWPLLEQDWIDDNQLLDSGGPYLDSVQYEVFGNDRALHDAFIEGAVDAMYDASFDVPRLGDVDDDEGLGVVTGFDDGYRHYTVNLRHEPLDDLTFRQILAMAMDETHWVETLNHGYEDPGSFVIVPAYEHVRPETAADAAINEDPATQAFTFREVEPGVMDLDGLREFLVNGEVIDGSEGRYVGHEYPGSLTGVETAQSESTYEYSYGEVHSDVLAGDGVERELYIEGEPFEEAIGRPLEMLTYPSNERPAVNAMSDDFIRNVRRLGVPIEREVVAFDSMSEMVYVRADFDIYPMRWSNTSATGIPTLYTLFHSDNAHEDDSAFDTFRYNASGYGLAGLPGADEMIEEARVELDEGRRNELVQRVAELIYLEAPSFVLGYSNVVWPVNTADYGGFIDGMTAPGSSNDHLQTWHIYEDTE